jgi:hypothetical protein
VRSICTPRTEDLLVVIKRWEYLRSEPSSHEDDVRCVSSRTSMTWSAQANPSKTWYG